MPRLIIKEFGWGWSKLQYMPLSSIPRCGGWTPGPNKENWLIEILLQYITNKVAKFLSAACPQEGIRCPDLGVVMLLDCYFPFSFMAFLF